MTTKKKDLEIVCNLQWKNKPTNTGDKSNIVGIYDIPATTLNWDIFKSYLLKNSGTAGNDVHVYYVDSEKKEIAVNSQMDFQIALYYIRQQARMGEIITLVLDRVSDTRKGAKPKRLKQSNVQTQADCSEIDYDEVPPEWFNKYMSKFKKRIVEEVTTAVSTSVKAHQPLCVHAPPRKPRHEAHKKVKKSIFAADVGKEKEYKKTLKMERKLENKLEKLEHKTLKIKAKKLALGGRPNEGDSGRNNIKYRSVGMPASGVDFLMDARPTDNVSLTIPHMNGGEKYKHSWEVCNSGKLTWTSETELRYAWGSQALMPISKRVPCPPLKPGEIGIVNVYLNIPDVSGNYECYWHFHHMGRRFGHWLGCHIIVDEPQTKNHKYDIINIGENYELLLPVSWTKNMKKNEDESKEENLENKIQIESKLNKKDEHFALSHNIQQKSNEEKSEDEKMLDTLEELNDSLKKLDLMGDMSHSNYGSDSDNQSIVSLADSNTTVSSNDNFVMVGMQEKESEEPEESVTIIEDKIAENKINIETSMLSDTAITTDSNETKSETNATIDSCEEVAIKDNFDAIDTDYAYIYFDGKKIPMLKKFLRPEYLATAEDALLSNKKNESTSSQSTHSQTDYYNLSNVECSSRMEHSCGISSDFSDNRSDCKTGNQKRLFVFPQSCPGFEVVYPSLEAEENQNNWTFSHHSNSEHSLKNEPTEFLSHANNVSPAREYTGPISQPCSRGNSPPCTETNQTQEQQQCHCDKVQNNHVVPQKSYDKVFNGAAMFASSAINTARNVINMVSRKEVGRWEKGKWVSTNPTSKRECGLRSLEDMGFWDRNLNATLLARYNDDVSLVVADLLQSP